MINLVVFDTGTGGKIFARHLRKKLTGVNIIEVIDSAHSPYGKKTPREIITLTESALAPYLNTNALILLACNTATAYAIDHLRKKYPNQTFIGTEPGIAPATQITENGRILVLATPATLRAPRYQNLKFRFASHLNILEPDCSAWAAHIDRHVFNLGLAQRSLVPYQAYQPDTIVLACTHYLAISPQLLKDFFPGAIIFSPLPAITMRIKALLPPQ